MARAGQEIRGQDDFRLRLLRTSAETGGELLEMEASYSGEAPMPPEHLHPSQDERFEVIDMLASDTRVAAVLRMAARLPNGGRFDEVVVHLWTFADDGSIVAMRRVLDTAQRIAAARG